MNDNERKMMVAFVFDSGNLASNSYGEVVFRHIMRGMEVMKNPFRMIVSIGDILVNTRYVDIEPYVINNEYCTIDFDVLRTEKRFKDYPFCWIVEDISESTATEIDRRLKNELPGYVGLTEIDNLSENTYKQFWKEMIRGFAIRDNTITVFRDPEYSDRFMYEECAKSLGYQVEYAPETESCNIDDLEILKSSFVKSESDLQIKQNNKSLSGADRDLWRMNFALNRELQIAGALIWKSVVDVSGISFCKESWDPPLIEASFFALYHAAQGVERLQKIIVELICKKHHIRQEDKSRIDDLLLTHNHSALNAWIEKIEGIVFSKNSKKLFNILQKFYNSIRYLRFSDNHDHKQLAPEYHLLKELAQGCKDEDFDYYIKNLFGKTLGEIAHIYYGLLKSLCEALQIYVNELYAFSTATIVFYGQSPVNLYIEYKHRQTEKKELLYWLISHGEQYPFRRLLETEALNFDPQEINTYLSDLINDPDNCETLHGTIDYLYDEMCTMNKELWKKHISEVDSVIGNTSILDEDMDCE